MYNPNNPGQPPLPFQAPLGPPVPTQANSVIPPQTAMGPSSVPFGPPAPISANGIQQQSNPGVVERILNILQATMGAPRNALFTLPGMGLHAAGLTGSTGAEGFDDFMMGGLDRSGGVGALNRASWNSNPISGLIASLHDLSPGLGRVAFQGITDPLNAVGGGIPEGMLAARALPAAGIARSIGEARTAAAAGQRIPTLVEAALAAGLTPAEMQARAIAQYGGRGASLMRGAATAEGAVQAGVGKAIGPALGAMAGGAVGGIPGAVVGAGLGLAGPGRILNKVPAFGAEVPEMVNDVMQMRPATSALDYLTSKTKRSFYKSRLGDLENAIQVLLANGHDLGTDVLDFTSPATAKFTNWKEAFSQTDNLYNALTQQIKDSTDPYTKLAGLEAVRQVEERMYNIWENVAVAGQKARDAGGSAADVGLATNTALHQGWAEMYHTLGAAQDVLRNIERGAEGRATMDPALAQTVASNVDQAMSQTWGLRRGLASNAASMPKDAILRLGEVQQQQLAGVRYRMTNAQNAIEQAFQAVGQQAPELGDQIAGNFQRRFNSLMAMQDGLRGGLSTELPSKFVGPLREDFQDFADKYQSLIRGRGVYENAIKELWDKYMPQGTPMPSLTGASPSEWWANINQRLATIQQTGGQQLLKGGPIADTMGLREALVPHVSSNTAAQIDATVKQWGKADILSDEPYRAAFDRVARSMQGKFGIADPKPGSIGAAAQWWDNNLMQPWKASQLMTPAYLMSNALGIATNSAMEGVSPIQIFKNLASTIGPRARGEVGQFGTHAVYTPDAMNMYKELGIHAPVQTQNGSALLADVTPTGRFSGKGESAIDRWGPLWLALTGGVGGASAGALTPGDPANRPANIATGAAVGAGLGASMPMLSKLILQRLSASLEGAARETAWTTGVNRYLDQNGALNLRGIAEKALKTPAEGLQIDNMGRWIPADTLDEAIVNRRSRPQLMFRGNPAPSQVASDVDAAFPPINRAPWRNPQLPVPNPPITAVPPTAHVTTHGMTPDEVDTILSAIDARHGRMSQADLERTLRAGGLSPEQARAAGMEWGDHLQAASDKGLNLANTINFDYEDLNNAEQMVKNVSPFATWGLKAYPFFAKNLAAHPVLAETILDMLDESRKEQKARGLTGRFDGTIEVNGVSKLLSSMMGREQHAYFNPLNALVPFSDLSSLQSMDTNNGVLSNLLDTSNAFGFGLRPELQTALRVGGASGDAPASGYIRSASFIKAITALMGSNSGRGIDLNAPFTVAERGIRGADNTPNLDESAITKKIDELAIRAVGVPTSADDARVGSFTAAKVTRKGPIWDRAAMEVAQDQAARAIPGFLLGQAATPRAILSGEESRVRGARLEGLSLSPDQSQQLSQQAQQSPNSPVDPAIVSQVGQAAMALAAEHGHTEMPPQVATLLASPTAANISQIQRWVYELEVQKSPLIQTYSGGGDQRSARLSNAISLYNNPAGLMSMDPNTLGLSLEQQQNLMTMLQAAKSLRQQGMGSFGTGTPIQNAATENKRMRDALAGALPDLGAYLQWRAAGGQGTAEDFLASQGR